MTTERTEDSPRFQVEVSREGAIKVTITHGATGASLQVMAREDGDGDPTFQVDALDPTTGAYRRAILLTPTKQGYDVSFARLDGFDPGVYDRGE